MIRRGNRPSKAVNEAILKRMYSESMELGGKHYRVGDELDFGNGRKVIINKLSERFVWFIDYGKLCRKEKTKIFWLLMEGQKIERMAAERVLRRAIELEDGGFIMTYENGVDGTVNIFSWSGELAEQGLAPDYEQVQGFTICTVTISGIKYQLVPVREQVLVVRK